MIIKLIKSSPHRVLPEELGPKPITNLDSFLLISDLFIINNSKFYLFFKII